MTLYIDSRGGSLKRSRSLPTYLSSHVGLADCSPTLTNLEFGDVMFIGNGPTGPMPVAIELKSIPDLVSSAFTGRLQAHQLPGMLDEYEGGICYLVYYGQYKPSPRNELLVQRALKGGKFRWEPFMIRNRPVPYGWLTGFLMAVDDVGFRRERLSTKVEMVYWLASLYRRYNKPWNKHKSFRKFNQSAGLVVPASLDLDERTIRKARVANELYSGMGFELGMRAAARFSSIRAMVNASVDDWSEIDRIGKVKAKQIVRNCTERSW